MKTAPSALINVLYLSAMVTIVVGVWVLSDLDGLAYYGTPMRVRGYAPEHALLKPSGTIAHPLGVIGSLMMLMPVLYTLRKKLRRLSNAGSLSTWLEVHIFCGIVGPVLATFHTSFRFNGIISVAYWSMVAVVLSGFMGRYLYVRIPKSIRGTELTREEIEARLRELTAQIGHAGLREDVLQSVDTGTTTSRRERRRIGRTLTSHGIEAAVARGFVAALAERTVLEKRLARLQRTKRLFSLWHVFHQPLVYIMFSIAILHVGVALYMGYSPW